MEHKLIQCEEAFLDLHRLFSHLTGKEIHMTPNVSKQTGLSVPRDRERILFE